MPKKDDPALLNAVQVLADAVRRERIPGVVEFRQLEDALKEIASEPSDNRWATADAAFNALDPDLRQRVADRAQQLAYKEAKTRRSTPAESAPAQNPLTQNPPAPNQTAHSAPAKQPAAPPPKKPSASPFLNALNRGKLGAR